MKTDSRSIGRATLFYGKQRSRESGLPLARAQLGFAGPASAPGIIATFDVRGADLRTRRRRRRVKLARGGEKSRGKRGEIGERRSDHRHFPSEESRLIERRERGLLLRATRLRDRDRYYRWVAA